MGLGNTMRQSELPLVQMIWNWAPEAKVMPAKVTPVFARFKIFSSFPYGKMPDQSTNCNFCKCDGKV